MKKDKKEEGGGGVGRRINGKGLVNTNSACLLSALSVPAVMLFHFLRPTETNRKKKEKKKKQQHQQQKTSRMIVTRSAKSFFDLFLFIFFL